MTNPVEASIVLETYTHGEKSNLPRLRLALQAATHMRTAQGGLEVLLADAGDDPEVAVLLRKEFQEVQHINARGLDYERAKALAARKARGRYLLYLDGDCLPDPGWLERHLESLQREDVVATGGFTRYDGGFLASVLSVMDFGFMFPRGSRALECYASNNSGFRRDVYLEFGVPEGPMRSRCYAHAQLLLRRGTPVQMVPDAVVHHALPHFFSERFRQGYDSVSACWADPKLPECRLLVLGPLSAPVFYARNVWLDWRRVVQGRVDLGFSLWQVMLAWLLFPVLRLLDLGGMFWASVRRTPRRWPPHA